MKYEGVDIPICTECSRTKHALPKPTRTMKDIHAFLSRELDAAITLNMEAKKEFEDLMSRFPSGLPHPDGVQHLKNVSRKVTIARMEMLRAHNRLNDFQNTGLVPEDLKEGPGS